MHLLIGVVNRCFQINDIFKSIKVTHWIVQTQGIRQTGSLGLEKFWTSNRIKCSINLAYCTFPLIKYSSDIFTFIWSVLALGYRQIIAFLCCCCVHGGRQVAKCIKVTCQMCTLVIGLETNLEILLRFVVLYYSLVLNTGHRVFLKNCDRVNYAWSQLYYFPKYLDRILRDGFNWPWKCIPLTSVKWICPQKPSCKINLTKNSRKKSGPKLKNNN